MTDVRMRHREVPVCHCEARSAEAISTEQRTHVRVTGLGGDCFGASRLAMTPWSAIVRQPLSRLG
jgi:hypothetical protein